MIDGVGVWWNRQDACCPLAVIARFECDLLSERVKSGLAAARARETKRGRQPDQRCTGNKVAEKVIAAVMEGRSCRWIARDLAMSKKTGLEIIKSDRQAPYGTTLRGLRPATPMWWIAGQQKAADRHGP